MSAPPTFPEQIIPSQASAQQPQQSKKPPPHEFAAVSTDTRTPATAVFYFTDARTHKPDPDYLLRLGLELGRGHDWFSVDLFDTPSARAIRTNAAALPPPSKVTVGARSGHGASAGAEARAARVRVVAGRMILAAVAAADSR